MMINPVKSIVTDQQENYNFIQNTGDYKLANYQFCNHRTVLIADENDKNRESYEQYIHNCYVQKFNASLNSYLPRLVGLYELDNQDQLKPDLVFGYGTGVDRDFFLESYLDEKLETKLSMLYDTPVKRSEIIEIGNLAINNTQHCAKDIYDIACFAYQQGFRWIVCTATRMLRLAFIHAGAYLQMVATADIKRLKVGANQWGSYYDYIPQIRAGNLELCIEQMKSKQSSFAEITG